MSYTNSKSKIDSEEDAINRIKHLSKRQRDTFDLICEYWCANDQLPSMRAISERLGFRSDTAAVQHIATLANRGLIERNEAGKFRFVRVQGVNLVEIYRSLKAAMPTL